MPQQQPAQDMTGVHLWIYWCIAIYVGLRLGVRFHVPGIAGHGEWYLRALVVTLALAGFLVYPFLPRRKADDDTKSTSR